NIISGVYSIAQTCANCYTCYEYEVCSTSYGNFFRYIGSFEADVNESYDQSCGYPYFCRRRIYCNGKLVSSKCSTTGCQVLSNREVVVNKNHELNLKEFFNLIKANKELSKNTKFVLPVGVNPEMSISTYNSIIQELSSQ